MTVLIQADNSRIVALGNHGRSINHLDSGILLIQSHATALLAKIRFTVNATAALSVLSVLSVVARLLKDLPLLHGLCALLPAGCPLEVFLEDGIRLCETVRHAARGLARVLGQFLDVSVPGDEDANFGKVL